MLYGLRKDEPIYAWHVTSRENVANYTASLPNSQQVRLQSLPVRVPHVAMRD